MIEKKLEWTDFKAFVAAKLVSMQYLEDAKFYYIYAVDGAIQVSCQLDKNPSDNTDLNDFVNNYKPTANTNLNQLDTDGAMIVRNKAAKKGWTFCSLPFEFETARLSDTLYSKDASDNSRSFITLKAYNSSDVEVTTPGVLGANYATITKTVIDFEPPYDFEIIGGDLRTLTTITDDMRLWIIAAPDIPAGSGGSKEMGGGINIKYLAPGNVFSVDGRVSKYAVYNATYHTNKIRLILKYPPGANENLMVVIQLYKL